MRVVVNMDDPFHIWADTCTHGILPRKLLPRGPHVHARFSLVLNNRMFISCHQQCSLLILFVNVLHNAFMVRIHGRFSLTKQDTYWTFSNQVEYNKYVVNQFPKSIRCQKMGNVEGSLRSSLRSSNSSSQSSQWDMGDRRKSGKGWGRLDTPIIHRSAATSVAVPADNAWRFLGALSHSQTYHTK